MVLAPELRVVDPDDALRAEPEAAERILEATLVLVARWGVAKTTLADVAKEAGCSRATVYRAFPGGKGHLLGALADRELAAYLGSILDAIDAADDLGEALTMALVIGARLLRDHDAAQFLLEHEPAVLIPFLGFHEVEHLYRHTAAQAAPHLERFLPVDRAAWAAEWAARLFITYLFNPADHLDLADPDAARRLVGRYLLPAFAADARPGVARPT
jgi:AcrR family transcriptional regulator